MAERIPETLVDLLAKSILAGLEEKKLQPVGDPGH